MVEKRICFAAGILVIGYLGASFADTVQGSTNALPFRSRVGTSAWTVNALDSNGKKTSARTEESFHPCAQKTAQRGRLFRSGIDNEEDEYQDSCEEQFLAAMEIGIAEKCFDLCSRSDSRAAAARRNAERAIRHMTPFFQEPLQRLVLRGGGRKNRDEDEDDEDEVHTFVSHHFLTVCLTSAWTY
jgi:hypothetical protein